MQVGVRVKGSKRMQSTARYPCLSSPTLLSNTLLSPSLLRCVCCSCFLFLGLSTSSLSRWDQYFWSKLDRENDNANFFFLFLLLRHLLGFLLLFFLLLLGLLGRCTWSRTTLLGFTSLLLLLLDAFDTRVDAKEKFRSANSSNSKNQTNVIYLSVRSTKERILAMSSFFLRARSDLFFFSVYRLSSRLFKGRKMRTVNNIIISDVPVTSFVDFLVHPLETSPTVKVVPKIIEPFNLFLGSIFGTEPWNRLYFRETGVKVEDRCEGLEKFEVLRLSEMNILSELEKS